MKLSSLIAVLLLISLSLLIFLVSATETTANTLHVTAKPNTSAQSTVSLKKKKKHCKKVNIIKLLKKKLGKKWILKLKKIAPCLKRRLLKKSIKKLSTKKIIKNVNKSIKKYKRNNNNKKNNKKPQQQRMCKGGKRLFKLIKKILKKKSGYKFLCGCIKKCLKVQETLK
ncbi:hypothetical protein ABK040_013338 [Willaertia magna]